MATALAEEKKAPQAVQTDPEENSEVESEESRVARYVNDEYASWRDKLDPYWADQKVNEQLYQGYDPEFPARVPSNTGTAIIESLVARTMDVSRKYSTGVKGPVGMLNRKVEQTVSSIAESVISDPDVAARHGSFDSAKEVFERDLFVTGNAILTQEYCYYTDEQTGRVIAEGVYPKNRTVDQCVFNPSYTLETSPVYYIDDWASFQSLEEAEYKEVVGEDGSVKVFGKYKNLEELKDIASENGKLVMRTGVGSESTDYYTAGGHSVSQWVEDISLKWRWEGAHLCLIAEDKVIIWEEYDPFGTGRNNVFTAMLYKYKRRPYAFGEMDWIRGLIRLKDQNLNQRAAVVERSLKVGVMVNDDKADLNLITRVILNGGAARGNATAVQKLNGVEFPNGSMMMGQEYDAQIEKTARHSNYASGVTNSSSDKTSGTASGINSLITAAEPNFKIKLRIIEERLETPYTQCAIKCAASLSSEDDFRWVMRGGNGREYAQVSKRFLAGRPTFQDMVMAGILTEEEVMQYTHTEEEQPVTDPMTGMPVLDPATGQVATQVVPVPIPGAMEAPYVDADWTIRVSLDPQTAADRKEKANLRMGLLEQAEQRGVMVDWRKAIPDIAAEMGDDDFDEYLLSEEQVQQIRQQQAQQAADAARQQEESAAGQHGRDMEKLSAQQQHEQRLAELNNSSKEGIAAYGAASRIPPVPVM